MLTAKLVALMLPSVFSVNPDVVVVELVDVVPDALVLVVLACGVNPND
jgi:hypothetical protein